MRTICGTILAAALAVGGVGLARPVPGPQLAARLAEGPEIIGIVHWGLNTFTDREWGYGNEDPALLNPTDFSADQIVGACKAGGIGGLVVVAKHHDGFCLWPTKTTEHNITKTPFWKCKDESAKCKTSGDYVKEMEQACRRAGLKFGVYCSPWDRNNAAYATPEYVKTYHAQVEELNDGRYGEIFEMWFDGANGGDGYYGGAWEKRSIGKAHDYYQFEKLWDRVRELQPKVCFFGGRDGFTWPGNESGIVPPESGGTRDDGTFQIYEADFPLRPGWFYHKSQDGYSRSGEFLMKIYLRTVGNGAVMDIGIAPDRRGRLTDEDAECLRRFSEIRKKFFSKPVVDASSPFNVIQMKEDVRHGERVDEWRVLLDGRELAKGGKIGTKRIRVLDAPVSGKELKLEIVKGDAKADEIKVELFAADEGLVRKVMASEEPKRPPSPFERKGVLTSRTGDTLVFMMKNAKETSSLLLTPDPDKLDGTPVAFRLAFSADGEKWEEDGVEYHLDNIAANPIPQTVELGRGIKVKYLRLKAVRTLKDHAAVHLKGLDFVDKAACVFVAAMSFAADAAESNSVSAYLETLRTPDGLYGWAGDDEGRLAATHAAVMTYKTFGANPPGDLKKMAASARGLNPCAGGSASARTHRHAALLHRVDVELAETVKALGGDTGNWRRYAETSPHHSKIDDYMRGYEAGGNAELSLEMQKLRLREVTGAALTDDTRAVFTAYLDSRERPDGSYATTPAKDGSGGHVVQTFWALYGRAFMGERLNPAAADWIDACRLPDGSFTWTSDAAQESRIGDMEYVRAAVKALALFGRRPKNEAALVKWIAARRNRDGGFGDRPGARSNPLATWAAVDALAALGKLDVALRSPPKTDSVKRVLPRNTTKLKVWTIQFEAPGTGSVRDTVEFARDAKIHLWGAKNSPAGWIDAAQRLADAEGVRVTFFPSDESYGARRVVPGLGSFSHVDDPVTPPPGATEPRQFNLWQICDHESAARILLDSGRYEAVSTFHFWCHDMTWLLSFERRYENDLVFVSNQDSHTETWWWQDMLHSCRTVFLAEEPTWDAFRDACRRRLVASVRQDSHTRGRLYIIASAPEVREHLLKRKAEWWPEPRDHSSDVSLRILSPGDTFETGRPEKGRRLRVRTFRKWLGDKFLQPAACRLEKVVCNGSELEIERFEKRLERNDYMNGNLEEAYDTAELPASGPLDIRAHFGPAEGSGLKPFTRRLKAD